jgi:TusA-related sulfurtransferase
MKEEVIEIITDFPSCKNNIEKATMKIRHEILEIVEDKRNFMICIKKK